MSHVTLGWHDSTVPSVSKSVTKYAYRHLFGLNSELEQVVVSRIACSNVAHKHTQGIFAHKRQTSTFILKILHFKLHRVIEIETHNGCFGPDEMLLRRGVSSGSALLAKI